MIVSARVRSLILLVPLLRGALAGPPRPPEGLGGKNVQWLNPELEVPASETGGQLASNLAHTSNVNVPLSPPPESKSGLETHPGQTGNANQPPHDQLTPPEHGLNHAHIVYDDKMSKTTCHLPPRTLYKKNGPRSAYYQYNSHPRRARRTAITPQGVMIDLPIGTRIIELTEDKKDKIILPTPPTGIQLLKFQTAFVLPAGTKYCLVSSPNQFLELYGEKFRIHASRSGRIAYTLKDVLVLLPADTIALQPEDPNDPDYMDLPLGRTGVRIVSKEHRDEVDKFCTDVHENRVPPLGHVNAMG